MHVNMWNSGPKVGKVYPKEQQKSACKHCRRLVDEFLVTDCLQEEAVEKLIIELNSDDQEDTDDDKDGDGDDIYSLPCWSLRSLSLHEAALSYTWY